MHPLINIAISAARNAAKIVMRYMDRIHELNITEKHHNDFVTEVDTASEQAIIDTISKAYPDHAFLGEEGGAKGNHDYTWIIDPLDGTANFIHGYPHFSIAIAVKHKDKLEHGLVYDPVRNELFTASRGDGAYLNERRIRVSKHPQLNASLLGISISPNRPEYFKFYYELLSIISPNVAPVRRSGSTALDFAYIAAGRIDGLAAFNQGPWDIAAGAVLVKEAGGLISDLDGEENYLETSNVIAGNPKIVKALLQTVNQIKKL